MANNIKKENKIELGKYLGDECYIIDSEYEDSLYAGYVSELNITFFINEEMVDPENGLFILTKGDRKWFPYFEKATGMWTYSNRQV